MSWATKGTIGTISRWLGKLEWESGDELMLAAGDEGDVLRTWTKYPRGQGQFETRAEDVIRAVQDAANTGGYNVEAKLTHRREGRALATTIVKRPSERPAGEDPPDRHRQGLDHLERMTNAYMFAHGKTLEAKDAIIADLRAENATLRKRITKLEERMYEMIDARSAEIQGRGVDEGEESDKNWDRMFTLMALLKPETQETGDAPALPVTVGDDVTEVEPSRPKRRRRHDRRDRRRRRPEEQRDRRDDDPGPAAGDAVQGELEPE